MDVSKKYLHDRFVLILITIMSALVVVGISLTFLRFDISKNPTTIVAYRTNLSGSSYISGKPIDIYAMAGFMALIAVAAVFLSLRTYHIRRYLAIFLLASAIFLLVLAIIVTNALISLQ